MCYIVATKSQQSTFFNKGWVFMEDDLDLVSMTPLREIAKTLVDACKDAGLLDLICKLLL